MNCPASHPEFRSRHRVKSGKNVACKALRSRVGEVTMSLRAPH